MGGSKMRGWFAGALAALLVCAGSTADAQSICRVTPNGSSLNSGESWASPRDLFSTIDRPSFDGACAEVWVARGLYKPPAGSVFRLSANQAIYGGFAGNETLRDQRDWRANRTVLSGDIDGNDVTDADGVVLDASGIVGNNAKYVFLMLPEFAPGITTLTVLDGFTITGGSNLSDGSLLTDGPGGGLLCLANNFDCSPRLANLTFSGNRARLGGGMAMVTAATGGSFGRILADVRNIVFSGNAAEQGGGLVISGPNSATPVLNNVTFSGNRASQSGGAVWLARTNLRLLNSTLAANTAAIDGGAVTIDGRIGEGGPIQHIANTTFHGNRALAGPGGAIHNPTSSLEFLQIFINNSTFSDNDATGPGEVLAITAENGFIDTRAEFRNVIIWENGPAPNAPIEAIISAAPGATITVDRAVVQAACPYCTNTTSASPLLGPLGNSGGAVPTRVPGTGSPAIDTGDGETCTAPTRFVNGVDARGVSRPQGPQCDLGAVEVVGGATPPPDPIFVNGFEAPPPG